MKVKEKTQAIKLRRQGCSVGEIASVVGVSKGSVSRWVRDVSLTNAQRRTLQANSHDRATVEKRRNSRIKNTNARHQKVYTDALQEAVAYSTNPDWCIGVSLYWGEGGKTQNMIRIANSDIAVIKRMMYFFRTIMNVPEKKFRIHIHGFKHSNVDELETYWSEVTAVPRQQFFKTYRKKSAASKHKRNTLQYGTVQIYVLDTNMFFRMMGWIDYIKQKELC